MEAIPAMPVSPAPAAEAANNARDAKGCEAADPRGFGNQLKHEIAARKSDAKAPAADETVADEVPADEKTETVAAAQAPVGIDPAVAALLGETAVQQPVAIALPVQSVAQQTASAGADDAAAADTAADIAIDEAPRAGAQRGAVEAAGERRATDRAIERGRERGFPERAAIERGAVERTVGERAAIERSAIERVSPERVMERAPVELRDLRPVRDFDERAFAWHDRSGADTSAASLPQGFTVDRGATGADAPLPVTASASALDSLSAAALGAKWGAPTVAGGTEVAAAPVTARVDTPLGTPGWGDAFQQKVVWMVDRHLEGAELHINPPHLGPVDVMLNLTADGAQIAFTSPHAAVREAIEASLPELRDALDSRGVSLGQASVGADSGAAREQFAEQAREAARNAQNGQGGRSGGPVVETPTPARAAIARRGLVDTFA